MKKSKLIFTLFILFMLYCSSIFCSDYSSVMNDDAGIKLTLLDLEKKSISDDDSSYIWVTQINEILNPVIKFRNSNIPKWVDIGHYKMSMKKADSLFILFYTRYTELTKAAGNLIAEDSLLSLLLSQPKVYDYLLSLGFKLHNTGKKFLLTPDPLFLINNFGKNFTFVTNHFLKYQHRLGTIGILNDEYLSWNYLKIRQTEWEMIIEKRIKRSKYIYHGSERVLTGDFFPRNFLYSHRMPSYSSKWFYDFSLFDELDFYERLWYAETNPYYLYDFDTAAAKFFRMYDLFFHGVK